MPVLRALRLEAALPWGDLGPVDFWALRRLASIWRRDAMADEYHGDMEGFGLGDLK
jgi:hypothetical protein